MVAVKKEALVPFGQAQMYSLVLGVQQYPNFLPWCEEVTLISSSEVQTKATLHLSWMGVKNAFTTQNTNRPSHSIQIDLLEGPFKYLKGLWSFESVGESACQVKLELQFEFENRILGFAFSKVFEQVANSLVDSFVKEAYKQFGENNHD